MVIIYDAKPAGRADAVSAFRFLARTALEHEAKEIGSPWHLALALPHWPFSGYRQIPPMLSDLTGTAAP